ncbi:MAG TPA: polysaccharide biosynthesis tyrosine autokinase, partial [Armatimonadota bacterium]|nr:polysaccharide biosynthesis tyrosine autokinase [Armatimonadota bacterium]
VEGGDSGSDVIRISAEGGDPVQVAALVNAMVDLHKEEMKKDQVGSLDDVVYRVRREAEKAARRREDAQKALIQFRKAHQVARLGTEQQARVREYVDLKADLAAAESDITSTKAQIADLEARLKQEPFETVQESTKDNPRYARLQERLDAAKADLEDQGPNLNPDGATFKALQKRVSDLEAQLKATPEELKVRTHVPNVRRGPMQATVAELEAKLRGYEADYNAAKAKLASRSGLVDDIGPWEVEQSRLERELESAQNAYDALTKQLRDLEIRQNSPLITVRELDRARVPTSPVEPKKTANIALTGILALCVAIGMAFLQEYLDDRVNSPDDIERISALPALGHVPLIQPDQPRLVNALPANSHVAESYRALRSSIGFAGIDAPLRRLQVTSASKGEGKTVTSVNLATAMAIDGKRVILVDADLRRPSVHRLLNLPNAPGLSEVLVGMKSVDEAIQETDVENMSVICAGPIPPNPAELLGSRAFDRVIEELETRADVVIFDSPPCAPVTDPLIISARMDGVILVIHTGHTKKAAIKHVEQLLARARARIVGCVFNRVEQNKGGYYYQHYYYHYGDGYYADAARQGD